jgi:uncharacterized protein
MPPGQSKFANKNKFNFSLDLRVVVVVLLVVIAAMLLLWRPWSTVGADDRTVSVTGEATVTAEPDEYAFRPSYRFANADREAALADMTKKSDEVVAELKKLGVEDSKIKTDSSGFDFPTPLRGEPEANGRANYTLSLTVTVSDKELAQKVQDYLLTTSPTGSVTPQYTFSDDRRRELESLARDQATQDARAKAEQSAENLGFRLGNVKQVTDGSGFGTFPFRGELDVAQDSRSSLSLQPGENELRYSVTVVYFVR